MNYYNEPYNEKIFEGLTKKESRYLSKVLGLFFGILILLLLGFVLIMAIKNERELLEKDQVNQVIDNYGIVKSSIKIVS